MPSTVYAEGLGLFHQSSGGTGVAPGDVCNTPPPSPSGPVPTPYVNTLQASNLTNGSQTVLMQGSPTALEAKSIISTSSGNEAGNQPGGVLNGKILGTGSFTTWSFTVKVEGMGVCRHGDLIGQNAASPPNQVCPGAVVNFINQPWVQDVIDEICDDDYPSGPPKDKSSRKKEDYTGKRKRGATLLQQDKANGWVRKNQGTKFAPGTVCWYCKSSQPKTKNGRFIADHQPPLKVAWYLGGCKNFENFKEWADRKAEIWPHCKDCNDAQVGEMKGSSNSDIRRWWQEDWSSYFGPGDEFHVLKRPRLT